MNYALGHVGFNGRSTIIGDGKAVMLLKIIEYAVECGNNIKLVGAESIIAATENVVRNRAGNGAGAYLLLRAIR